MKKIVFISIMCILMACTTLNNEAMKNKLTNKVLVEQKQDDLRQLNVFKVWSDSTEFEEEILFWPKGIIKYSATHGFEGEVAQMTWHRKNKRQVKLKEMQNEKLSVSQTLKLKQDQALTAQTVLKKRKPLKFLALGFGVVMVLVGLAYFFYQGKLVWKG